jgi:hypothetical protein
MILLHLAGHSGAGKSRLIAALPKCGISVPRAVLYTSRAPRDGEVHGRDYYFLSKGAIAALPRESFFVGNVREMLQAVDLQQLQESLESEAHFLVLVEIFADLWPDLRARIAERFGGELSTASVFLTAVDPEIVKALSDNEIRGRYIHNEVERILTWRQKDEADKVASRAKSAVDEVLAAVGQSGDHKYDYILHSSAEGPDGADDWTRAEAPVGRAKQVLDTVVGLVKNAAGTGSVGGDSDLARCVEPQ